MTSLSKFLAVLGVPTLILVGPPQDRALPRDAAKIQITDRPESSRLAIEAASRLIQGHLENLDIPGLQIAVVSKGQTVWSGSFGVADLEKNTPVTPSTTFRVGSVSKSLTGAALGLLVQRRLLDLDRPVSSYLPSFPKKRWPITVRQVAGHLAGIRHYRSPEEASSTKHYSSVFESLEQFQDDPLLFEPGTKYEYSSYGYILLSAIIEAVTQQEFSKFMRQEIFLPFGMISTSMDSVDPQPSNRAKFYAVDKNDKRVLAPFVDNSGKWAAGGMISTAEDLVRFGNTLLAGSILRRDIVRTLFASMKTRDGKDTGYGIGWEIGVDASGRKIAIHDGQLPGARAVLALHPEEQLVVAVLINTGTSVLFNQQEALMLADLFLDARGLHPSEELLKDLCGSYTYSTSFDQDSIVGKISLFKGEAGLQGTMTIPNRFFKNRLISVPVIRVTKDEVNMIGLPGNWIYLAFKRNGSSITGRWRFGPLKGELVGTRD